MRSAASDPSQHSSANAYEHNREIFQKLLDQKPSDPYRQRDLAQSWEGVGELLAARGELRGPLKDIADTMGIPADNAYANYLEICQQLANQDPANANWQRELAGSWGKVGEMRQQQGDLKGAAEAFAQKMEISQRLAFQDPGNEYWQRSVAVSSEKSERYVKRKEISKERPTRSHARWKSLNDCRLRIRVVSCASAIWQKLGVRSARRGYGKAT